MGDQITRGSIVVVTYAGFGNPTSPLEHGSNQAATKKKTLTQVGIAKEFYEINIDVQKPG